MSISEEFNFGEDSDGLWYVAIVNEQIVWDLSQEQAEKACTQLKAATDASDARYQDWRLQMTDIERVTRIAENHLTKTTDGTGRVMWIAYTSALLAFEQSVLEKRDEEHNSLVGQLELHIELCHKEIASWKARCERRVSDIKELEKRHADRLESIQESRIMQDAALQSVYWTDEGRIEADMPAIEQALNSTQADVDKFMAEKKAEWEKGALEEAAKEVTKMMIHAQNETEQGYVLAIMDASAKLRSMAKDVV